MLAHPPQLLTTWVFVADAAGCDFHRDPCSRMGCPSANAHPDHHAIARGMAWVALFVLLGKLAGAAKEMAIAYRYGVSVEVDAYLFVFNLVNWPVGVWFSVLTVVRWCLWRPASSKAQRRVSLLLPGGAARPHPPARGSPGAPGLVGVLVLLRSPWTGLPSITVTIATNMAPALALLAPLGVLISLFSAWMLSAGRHANTLLESVPALVILLAL